MVTENFSGWVGPVDDLKSLVKEFRLLKDQILTNHKRCIKEKYIDHLRENQVSVADFLVSLDRQIEKFDKEAQLILSTTDVRGEKQQFADLEIDEELNRINASRIKAFEIEIKINYRDSNFGMFGPIVASDMVMSLKASKDSNEITITSNSKDSELLGYLAQVKNKLEVTSPKHQWINSTSSILIIDTLVGAISACAVLFWGTIFEGLVLWTLLAFHLILSLSFTWFSTKWIKKLNPKFEVFSNNTLPPAIRTRKTILAFIVGFLFPFILFILSKLP